MHKKEERTASSHLHHPVPASQHCSGPRENNLAGRRSCHWERESRLSDQIYNTVSPIHKNEFYSESIFLSPTFK